MQVEGGRDHRGESDGRSHPSVGLDTAKDKHLKLHGISEGKKCDDDI